MSPCSVDYIIPALRGPTCSLWGFYIECSLPCWLSCNPYVQPGLFWVWFNFFTQKVWVVEHLQGFPAYSWIYTTHHILMWYFISILNRALLVQNWLPIRSWQVLILPALCGSKGVYNPKAFFPHAASLDQAFAHCPRFPVAATRRCMDRVSVPLWLADLSAQLLVIALVSLYLTNKLIRRRPLLRRAI